MGFRFRRSIKLVPGVRINIGKKGVSSVSLGGRGARVTVGTKGVRKTVGLPGTGLSHTSYQSFNNNSPKSQLAPTTVVSQSYHYSSNNSHTNNMIQQYCIHCRHITNQKKSFGIISYLLAGFFTGGLWFLIGLIYHFGFQTPTCTVCGNYSNNKKLGMKKNWFITYLAIMIFLAFIKDNALFAIIVPAIILGIFGLKEYKKRKELKMRAQLEIAELNRLEQNKIDALNRLEQSKNEVAPYVEKFISSFTKDWSDWPQNIAPTHEQVNALIFLINRDRETPVDGHIITDLLYNLLDQRRYLIFKNSFIQKFSTLYPQINAPSAANVYQLLFSKNMTYLYYLNTLLQENGIYIDEDNLRNLIIQEYNTYILTQHANELDFAMTNHLALGTPLTIKDTDDLDGIEFENILAKLFEKMGYTVLTTPRSGDQGADLLLEKNGCKTVVQAKRYTNKLDNTPIQEVVAAKYHYQYNNAMVVTNNYFTAGAKELARTNQVRLVDRDELHQLLIDYPINK